MGLSFQISSVYHKRPFYLVQKFGKSVCVALAVLDKTESIHCSLFLLLSTAMNLGHRTGKGQFSFQSQRKAMPKNAQTTAQWHSSHKLVKILQARLQQYVNCELPDVQAGFRKGKGSRDQTANIRWIIEKAREFQKNTYFCFIDYAKAFDCVDHKKLWKILKEMGIPDHLTCHLRNLYAGQEAIVRTGHETTDWFQTGKGVHRSCILSPCLFNFYAEYIIRNAGLDEAQAGMKIARRNINNLRYAMQMTLPLWQKVKKN